MTRRLVTRRPKALVEAEDALHAGRLEALRQFVAANERLDDRRFPGFHLRRDAEGEAERWLERMKVKPRDVARLLFATGYIGATLRLYLSMPPHLVRQVPPNLMARIDWQVERPYIAGVVAACKDVLDATIALDDLPSIWIRRDRLSASETWQYSNAKLAADAFGNGYTVGVHAALGE